MVKQVKSKEEFNTELNNAGDKLVPETDPIFYRSIVNNHSCVFVDGEGGR